MVIWHTALETPHLVVTQQGERTVGSRVVNYHTLNFLDKTNHRQFTVPVRMERTL